MLGNSGQLQASLLSWIACGYVEHSTNVALVQTHKIASRPDAADENAGMVLVAMDFCELWVPKKGLLVESHCVRI